MKPVKISIFHNIHKPGKNNRFPVELRVYYCYTAKRYATGIRLTKEDFAASYLAERPRGDFRKINNQIDDIQSKAKTIVSEMREFSFDKFERLMFAGSGSGKDLFFQYDEKIRQLKIDGQVKTARNYENSMKSLLKYMERKKPHPKDAPRPRLSYRDINPAWLHSYEAWMVGRGRSLTTVSIYMRPLRFIYNEAIRQGIIERQDSPFGRGRFLLPGSANTKKALNKQALAALLNVSLPPDDPATKARDFFFFSYICNGMNFKDISRLRYKNIQDDSVVFMREKTKNILRGQSPLPVRAILNDFARGIIEKYGDKNQDPNNLIFPIVSDLMTEVQKMDALNSFIRNTNIQLKKLASKAGVTTDISTYYARHSFSTMAKRNGAGIEFIRESLGHRTTKSTQFYLDSFEDHVRKEIAGKLMDF